ncbi:MAG: zinc ribbon domain-containing protein [Anaerolineales bacterium]
MKTCPHCGKSVPDYATRCKYCDEPIPIFQPVSSAESVALVCPSCGASLDYDTTSTVVSCAYCGNRVVVPARAVEHVPDSPMDEQSLPLTARIQHLVDQGRTDAAVDLIRHLLSIQKPEAEQLLEILLSGQAPDVQRLFYNFEHGIYHS